MPANTTYKTPSSDYIESIRVHMDGTPGQVEIKMTITAHTESEIVDNLTGGPGPINRIGNIIGGAAGAGEGPWTVEVGVNQRRFGKAKSVVNNIVNGISNQLGIGSQMLLNNVRNASGSFDVSPFSRSISINAGETKTINSVVNFQPIVIPVPDDVSLVDRFEDRLGGRVPNISFTFTMPHDTTLTTIQETYSIDVPLEAFIEERELDVGCSEMYSDIMDKIENVRGNTNSKLEGARQARTDLRDYANEILSGAGGGIGGGQIVDQVRNISASDLTSVNTSRLQEIRSNIESIDTREDVLSTYRSSIDDLRSQVRDTMSPNCVSELNPMDKLNQIEEDILQRLGIISREISDLKSSLLDALSNIESIDCSEAFDTIENKVQDLESKVGVGQYSPSIDFPIRSGIRDEVEDEISTVENQIENNITPSSFCYDELKSRVDEARSQFELLRERGPTDVNLSCTDVDDNLRSTIEEFEEEARNFITSKQGNKLDLLETGRAIRERIDREVSDENPCKQELLNRIRGLVSNLQGTERGCGDISNDIRSEASSFTGAIRQFVSKDQLARLPEKKENLLTESEDVIERIETEVSDKNPCKSELLSRVREQRSKLRRTPVRPESAVPCERRFEDLGSSLESFENQILSLSPPINPEQVQSIAEEGQSLISQIEENIPEDSDCRVEMSERVRQYINRAENLVTQVRVETQEETEGTQRRQELIDQLLGSIDTIQAGAGDGDVADEIQEQV